MRATSAYLDRPCRSLAAVLLVRAEREIDAALAVAAAHSAILDAAAMLRQAGIAGWG
jgi:hypothetical protein